MRRERLAALLGRLLLAEPDDDVARIVAAVPTLAPLAAMDRECAASEYERLLLRSVPLHESGKGGLLAAADEARQQVAVGQRRQVRADAAAEVVENDL